MDPSSVSCPTLACADKGRVGGDNIRIHSHVERRYRCRTCGHTFAATTNTPLYRLHHPAATMTLVLTLLLHGCPIPAIVAAFALDERTVCAWLHKAGAHAATADTAHLTAAHASAAEHFYGAEHTYASHYSIQEGPGYLEETVVHTGSEGGTGYESGTGYDSADYHSSSGDHSGGGT